MNFHTILNKLAAAFLGALLLLFAGLAQAQTVSNVARATWTTGSQNNSINSNTVAFDVVTVAATIEALRVAPGAGRPTSYTPSLCGTAAPAPGSAGTATNLASLNQTANLRAGEQLFFRLTAPGANRDSTAIDRIVATLTTTAGDREDLTVFETAPDSGIFIGAIPTVRAPPAPTRGDCRLSAARGEIVSIETHETGQTRTIATVTVDILADPFGLVFDSEDGTPIDGAMVTLVDAASGAPARVFADDGVSSWPSTVTTGQTVFDGAGNAYPMAPGEYRFPFAALGNYRLVVTPPAPYSVPSSASAAQLAGLTRPDGGALLIVPGSYGSTFALATPVPVRIDIPADRPSLSVALTKQASRASAVPGEVVLYTVTARNDDPARAKRQVTLADTPSPWLRLRPDSVRIDGAAAPAAVQIAPDGRQLAISLGDIPGGGSRVVTYAMTVRADAPPGQALNRAVATDARGNQAIASAAVRIDRETIAGRMTLIGRITGGDCSAQGPRPGVPGVRVMLEDGSFAITDADGRYHFEGLVPGTHVVQAQRTTLPGKGAKFVDCTASTRSAGSPSSRFVTGQGGSLAVADFHAIVGEVAAPTPSVAAEKIASDPIAAGAQIDWFAAGNGPDDFLFPAIDHNPRAPAVRVVIRHRAGHKVALSADGRPVDGIAFDGARVSPDGLYAVSVWRGIPLRGDTTRLTAQVDDASGAPVASLKRDVRFVATPARVEIVAAQSRLIADGATRPVLAVRVTDRHGRPVHAGLAGDFSLNAPYESAAALDAMQARVLANTDGFQAAAPHWSVKGDDGIALIELAPTLVSGALKLDFAFTDGEVRRSQTLESWIVPGDTEWTLVGLAEGAAGSKTIADAMDRSGRFDSDLGKNARVAFYAKGRVLGSTLLTVAYDSAKDRADQRLLGAIDPGAYYTVFADGSDRRYDAASRNRLYVRVENRVFYALYGDFETGFDQTELARYQRTATGVKGEAASGGVHASAFAARIASRHRRDEIQGNGLTGPYRLSSRAILANSETVIIERRDRFRSELVIERKPLTRFIDYDIDLLSGTIRFSAPVLSRDADLNPQFIVVDFEVDELSGGKLNAGLRADWTSRDGGVRIGGTVITDASGNPGGDTSRTDLAAVDVKARLGAGTELRAELAASRSAGKTAKAWQVEAEHHDGRLDVLAYAHVLDADFGLGQQNRAEQGRQKIGVDARVALGDGLSVTGSGWVDDSKADSSRRTAVELRAELRRGDTDARIGVTHFADRLADGARASSTVLEGGITRRLLDNRLELDASTSVALGKSESIDLPARHRLGARYRLTQGVKLLGTYEIAEGDAIDARTARLGLELTPWDGARATGTLGQQDVREQGKRSFAAFGLAQSIAVTANLTLDASLDANRVLGGFDASKVINPEHPVASGGFVGEASGGEGGVLSEDFTALTLGAGWRSGRWSATARGEYRDGEFADRTGFTFGAIRQLGEGSVIGSGFTWTRAEAPGNGLGGGATSEVFDGAISAAHRPTDAPVAFLAKLEYRSDLIADAVLGEAGPAGRTALTFSGDARSRRVIGSLSTNWAPLGRDEGQAVQRSEIGLFTAVRHNFDRFDGFDIEGTSLLGGLDVRIGLTRHIEIGGAATVRTSLADHTTLFAVGPQLGISPVKDMLLLLGYNFKGFRDRDFAAARNTDKGLYASVKLKVDADSLAFLGLGE